MDSCLVGCAQGSVGALSLRPQARVILARRAPRWRHWPAAVPAGRVVPAVQNQAWQTAALTRPRSLRAFESYTFAGPAPRSERQGNRSAQIETRTLVESCLVGCAPGSLVALRIETRTLVESCLVDTPLWAACPSTRRRADAAQLRQW